MTSAGSGATAPAEFAWGTATAAYQIEGGATADGKGPSTWDTFAHTPGTIERGETGDVACDHYHRWRDDLDLMQRMRLNAYRFSVAWARVQPDGRGAANDPGLDYYDQLVDGLLARGIAPYVTLFHWDLPQALQDRGGWRARDTALRFADYADLVTRRLGDRVQHWITLNEPYIVTNHGHVEGIHAPGLRDAANFFPVLHHLLLGHGLALPPIRANAPGARVGVAFSLAGIEPAGSREEQEDTAARADAYINTAALDPILRGHYPAILAADIPPDLVQPGDLDSIGAPTEFVGVNYYLRLIVRAAPNVPLYGFTAANPTTRTPTAMGWEVYPAGLDRWLRRLAGEYPARDLYVTENGVAYPDAPGPEGAVTDPRRIDYLRAHIGLALQAAADGLPVKGYFVWSFMDNFEWAVGYRPRFGLVYVDFPTQRRTIKASGHWYARLAATGSLDAAE